MKKVLFKLMVVVVIVSLLATIFVPFSVRSSQATLTSMYNTYRGVGSTSVWKMAIQGYSNSYCVNGGASLYAGTSLSDQGSFYSNSFSNITSSPNAMRWILDNMYLTDSKDQTMQTDMKNNIRRIIREYVAKKNSSGKSYLAVALGLNSISEEWISNAANALVSDKDTTFAVQQYALWSFTKNNSSSYNSALQNSDGSYNKLPNAKIEKQYYIGYFITLKEMAKSAQSNNYVSPNVNGNYDISIQTGNKITKKVESDKKTIVFGPYTLKNNSDQIYKTFTAAVNGETASYINFVDANGKAVDINSYKGEFYFKVTYNKGFYKGVSYKITVSASFRGYKTFANVLNPGGNNGSYQPVVSVRKEAFSYKRGIDLNHREEITGKYSLEILKTGIKNTPLSGVKFKISQGTGSEQTYTTNNSGIAQIVNNKELKKAELIKFNVSEVQVADNTYAPLAEGFQVNVLIEEKNEEYKPTKVSFANGTNTKEVKLKNGKTVTLVANITGNTVKVTVPNEKITGSYYLDILKKDENGNALPGVTFTVQSDTGSNLTTAPTGKEGKTTVCLRTITSEGTDTYTIKEIKTDKDYITLKDELKVYVKKEIKDYQFKATSVSFDSSKASTSKEVQLKDGSTVTVNATIENGRVCVTIPNKKIEGNYSLEILKVDENNKPLSGVNFKVASGTNTAKTYGPTGSNGIVSIINNQKITGSGVDTYTISEVSSKDNQYITLKDAVKVYVTKEIKNYKYVASKVSFETGKETTSKEVSLNNGTKVTIYAKLQNGKITITIPNKKIVGSYNLEIKKIELGSSKALSGATFKVQTGTNLAKKYGPTGESGTVSIVSNYPITSTGTDEYTVSEVSIDKDYITLKDSFKIYVTKEIKDYKYVASKVSFEKGKETLTKKVTLKDGSKVNVKVSVTNGTITITVPNKKITGNYSLELEKVNSENESEKLEGVTFKVQEGSNEAKKYGPTDEDGIVSIVEGKAITSVGVDEFTISEIEINNEDFVEVKDNVKREGFYKLKESFKVYITKGIKDNNYVVENVSFDKNKIEKTKNVQLEDGSYAELKATIIGNTVKITIPNKPDTKQLNFDLALRKYITKVTRNGKSVNIGEDRTPVINEFSSVEYEKTKTAGYYHTKSLVTVKPGDTVLYTIRVYNEGDIEGFAKEITDYLPQGLEYVENSAINKANKWTVTKNEDGTATVKTNKLAGTVIKPANGAEGFREYAESSSKKAPEFSNFVQIECKVKSNIQDKKMLVNVAEITNYGYLNDEGKYVEAKKARVDIDSKENNVFSKKSSVTNIDEYYDNVVVPQNKENNTHYKGLEDDDDFENLYVEPEEINIKFVLNKVDEDGNPLIGADFTVERQKDDETKVLLNNEEVKGTYEVIEQDVRYNKTYSYKVVEVESAPEYVNVMEGKYITIRTYLTENKELVLGNYENVEAEDNLISKYGFVINNEDGSIVLEKDTDLYEKIKVEVRNNTEPAQIVITIPNEKMTGKYSLELEKVDSLNPDVKLAGATFSVTSNGNKEKEYGPTAENGKVTVSSKTEIKGTGVDEYSISELSLTDESYITLKDSFNIYVTKVVKNKQYVASKVSFEKGKNITSKEVTLKDGTKVNVSAQISKGKITVTVPNKKVTGSYSLELEKVNSENESEKLAGVKFTVQEGKEEAKEYGPTGENGKVTVFENKAIKAMGTDEYTITELSLNQENYEKVENNVKTEGFIKIKESFKIYVTKEVRDNSYKATKVSFDNLKEEKTKKVELEDGTFVTLKASIVGNMVKITIPNKPDTKQLNFDLALRKYITKVTRNGKVVNIGEDRTPVINEFSCTEYEETKTLGYYHTKTPVTVKPGDTILYTLRVYNEGDIEGFAKEITDYLPEGLEYVAESKINKEYGWVAITKSNGTVVTTSKLSNTVIKPANGIEGFREYVESSSKNDPEFSNFVQIECKVKSNIQDKKLLVNVAEITNYGYLNDEGNYVEANQNKVDIDSTENNVFTKNAEIKDIDTYYDKQVVPQKSKENKAYKGIEDDDDFENVYVEPDEISIKFVLNKVDQDGKPLDGAKFTIERDLEEQSKKLLNNKVVNGTFKTVENNVRYNNVYTYKITENESAEDYINALENKYITIKTYLEESKKFVLGNTKNVEEEANLIGKYGFIINNEDGTIVKEDETDLYSKIKVTLNNDVVPAEIAITIPNQEVKKDFDLALRKFITAVKKQVGTENEKETAIINRVPKFKIDKKGNYVYEHTKDPVVVAYGNIVTYTLRVYNEGDIDGYAKLIKDDIPEGLEFLPEDPLNKVFRWVMLDKDGKETKEAKNAVSVASDYLSKENEKSEYDNLILAFDKKAYEEGKIKEPYYKEVKVSFKVTKKDKFDEIVINHAQISKHSDKDGKEDIKDKDSTPDKWIDGEDDQDIEKVKVQYFDLALRKWVTKAITTENGVKTVTETGHKAEDDPEQIVKVDLKDSKINDVTVKFEYSIRVKNEGQIAGYAKEIADYIPEGLKFVKEDNPDWKEQDGKVITEKLKDTLLKPGETAEVTILLTWINDKKNLGLKVNTAEINKDYNEEGSPDIDSTPGNKVPGEDDIDDAPVMLTVKTGQEPTYVALAGVVLVMLVSGTVLIKKFVLK